jgi:hypothetical protein
MPKEPSAVELQMRRHYPRFTHPMLRPLPTQGSVVAELARITIIENDPEARGVQVKVELDNPGTASLWFAHDQRGYRMLPAVNGASRR